MRITIHGKPYEYGTNEQNSFGVYIWALYDFAIRHNMLFACARIQILYRSLDINNQRWMMAMGFVPVKKKQKLIRKKAA